MKDEALRLKINYFLDKSNITDIPIPIKEKIITSFIAHEPTTPIDKSNLEKVIKLYKYILEKMNAKLVKDDTFNSYLEKIFNDMCDKHFDSILSSKKITLKPPDEFTSLNPIIDTKIGEILKKRKEEKEQIEIKRKEEKEQEELKLKQLATNIDFEAFCSKKPLDNPTSISVPLKKPNPKSISMPSKMPTYILNQQKLFYIHDEPTNTYIPIIILGMMPHDYAQRIDPFRVIEDAYDIYFITKSSISESILATTQACEIEAFNSTGNYTGVFRNTYGTWGATEYRWNEDINSMVYQLIKFVDKTSYVSYIPTQNWKLIYDKLQTNNIKFYICSNIDIELYTF